jgi:hypothetical protein
VGSPELYENRVLGPKPLRCFSASVHELKRNGKLRVTIDNHSEHTSHRLKQLLFINDWDLDNSQPILFLPVEIELEDKRVELEDRLIRTVHQILRRG